MGRKKQSGFFETFFKQALGVGTTVHYKTDWLGRKQKVVKHHDSGKKKTYTHGCGIFGNTTKTATTKGFRTVETGKLKNNIFFGATEHAKKTDGTRVKRTYSPSIIRDHLTTEVRGVCFGCEGTGSVTRNCPSCKGTGVYRVAEKRCFNCAGTGRMNSGVCDRCNGTGVYKAAFDVPCRRCGGVAQYSSSCKKCGGSGVYTHKKRQGYFS